MQSNLAAVEENPLSGPLQLEAAEVAAFEARRRENATWRLMKMQELQVGCTPLPLETQQLPFESFNPAHEWAVVMRWA